MLEFLRTESFISRNREHCSKYLIFNNKEDLKPILPKQSMERCQIDFAVFVKKPSKDENGNIYKCALSCFDVLSRYIFLRSLKSKDTIERANQLKEICMTFGSPKMLQCDKDSEFQGMLVVIYCLHLLTEQ